MTNMDIVKSNSLITKMDALKDKLIRVVGKGTFTKYLNIALENGTFIFL